MTIAVVALGVLVGMFFGLGIAWLIVRKWERQAAPLEPLDDSYRRLSTHVRSVSDQRWVR